MSAPATGVGPSFEVVYEEQRLPLIRLAVLLTGSREHAEDAVQAVFTAAFPRWNSIAQPLSYLKRAVVNSCADVHRRRARDRRAVLDREPVTGIPEVDETWAVLRDLPPRQRAVVVLHFYEDLPLVQIGRLLGRPAATVRSDLRRALVTLREDLA